MLCLFQVSWFPFFWLFLAFFVHIVFGLVLCLFHASCFSFCSCFSWLSFFFLFVFSCVLSFQCFFFDLVLKQEAGQGQAGGRPEPDSFQNPQAVLFRPQAVLFRPRAVLFRPGRPGRRKLLEAVWFLPKVSPRASSEGWSHVTKELWLKHQGHVMGRELEVHKRREY